MSQLCMVEHILSLRAHRQTYLRIQFAHLSEQHANVGACFAYQSLRCVVKHVLQTVSVRLAASAFASSTVAIADM